MNFQINKEKIFSFLICFLLFSIFIAGILFYFQPIEKFKKARDADRWADVSAISKALVAYKKDQGGADLFKEIDSLYRDDWYMIVGGNMIKGCDDSNIFSNVEIFDDHYCLNFSDLVEEGYLGELPVAPSDDVEWDKGLENGSKGTGYAFMIDEEGVLHIQSCETESFFEINIDRKYGED